MVPKYFVRVCSSKEIPDSNGIFFPQYRPSSVWFHPDQELLHVLRQMTQEGLWELRVCENVDGSDDRCRAVVGDGGT